MSDRQTGFSILEAVLVVAAIGVVGAAGWFVYQHNRVKFANADGGTQTTNQGTSQQQTTPSQTQQNTAATTTHQAADGSLSFSYPQSWSIDDSLNTPAAEDAIVLEPVSALSSSVNAFRMTLFVVTNADAQPGYLPDGTIQKLTNGINLWTSSLAHSEVPLSPTSTSTMACPRMKIVSADEKHFSYPLNNGKFLTVTAGYCQSDKDTTSQTYDQLLASQEWQSAVAVIQSIQIK